MALYPIAFNDGWVPELTLEELRERATSDRALIKEMTAALPGVELGSFPSWAHRCCTARAEVTFVRGDSREKSHVIFGRPP